MKTKLFCWIGHFRNNTLLREGNNRFEIFLNRKFFLKNMVLENMQICEVFK